MDFQGKFHRMDERGGSVAFIICYALQYGLVLILNSRLTIDHYYNHLIGMAFYTVINFLVNKFYTFKA